MNLAYSAEYDRFRAEVRAFLEAHWRDEPVAAADPNSVAAALGAVVGTDAVATAFRKAAIARGYLYRSVPRRYGGGEQPPDPLKAVIIGEEFRRACPRVAVAGLPADANRSTSAPTVPRPESGSARHPP